MRLEAPRQPKCRRIHCRLPTGPIDKLEGKQIPLENLFIHIGTHKNYTSKHRGGCGELPPKRNCAQREVDSFFFLCPPYEGVTGGPIVVYNPGRGSDKIRFDRPSDFFFSWLKRRRALISHMFFLQRQLHLGGQQTKETEGFDFFRGVVGDNHLGLGVRMAISGKRSVLLGNNRYVCWRLFLPLLETPSLLSLRPKSEQITL